MSTDATIANALPQYKLSFYTTVDNNLRVTSPVGKIPNTPYFDNVIYALEAPNVISHATTVTPQYTVTATGVQFANPS